MEDTLDTHIDTPPSTEGLEEAEVVVLVVQLRLSRQSPATPCDILLLCFTEIHLLVNALFVRPVLQFACSVARSEPDQHRAVP